MPPRTALILDLAGELFTDLGREVILRRLAEEALGAIHSNVWKYEYIHHCNQLAWFSPGRLMACLLLERHWPRIRPYTELAIADLRASLDGVILRDGGYEEGPTYFRCVGRDGGLSFYLYAKARGVPLASVLPECMKRCGDFGEAIESTDDGNDVIPICDAGALHDMASLATMASILPAGAWGRMLRKAMGSRGGAAASKRHHRAAALADLTMALALTRSSPEPASCPKPFVFLPQMGLMASTRLLAGQPVKMLIMGNQSGAGHTHEDKGSFVLELAGETLAMDPGSCSYSSPFAAMAKWCSYHNMLVPTATADRPHPACPLSHDVRPEGEGDRRRFRARIDATAGWDECYEKWVRSWESFSPDSLIIRDEYALLRGDGVEFLWITAQDVTVEGRVATVSGRRGRAVIEAERDCAVRVESIPFQRGLDSSGRVAFHRIAIGKPGRVGILTVKVRLEVFETASVPSAGE